MNDGRVLVGKDLSAAGTQTANCYVVNTTDANKWYRFKATIRGNGAATSAQISYTGTDIPANDRIAPDNAALVWETREGDKAPTLDYVGYSENGYIVFKLGEATEGNAVVAAKKRRYHSLELAHLDYSSIRQKRHQSADIRNTTP